MLKRKHLPSLTEELLCKELSFLLNGGLSLTEAVDLLADQTSNPSRKKFLVEASNQIKNGSTLAESLANQEASISKTTQNIIAVGERSGTLVESLLYASVHLNKQATLKRKLITALIYPALTVLITLLVGGGIMFYVFPKILPVIESLNVPLPWTTRTLIAIHHFLSNYSILLFIGIITIAIVSFITYKHQLKFRYQVDRLAFHFPLFGKLIKNYELATITRHLGLLLKNHETLDDAWIITTNNISNVYIKTIAESFFIPLQTGQSLAGLWQKHPKIFPPTMTQFLNVSENSGHLKDSLLEIANRYEEAVDDLSKTASSLIEPLLMTIIGLGIGFLALAILSPIYEITAHLNR